MYDDIENLPLDRQKSDEIKQKLHGKPYLWKDVWYCIFNNTESLPESISILCRIKVMDENAGIVHCTNPSLNTYVEWYFDDVRLMDGTYKISKKKILRRDGLTIGWEGKILNYAERS